MRGRLQGEEGTRGTVHIRVLLTGAVFASLWGQRRHTDTGTEKMRLFIFCSVVLLACGSRAQHDVGGGGGGASRFPSSPLLPIAPVAAYHTQSRISTGPTRVRQSVFASPVSTLDRTPSSVDPCRPNPCGPNTRCERAGKVARCHCIADYVPKDNTIEGCQPQCVTNDECPSDMMCRSQKCVKVCERGACGVFADCKARNHAAECTCPPGYGGDPYSRCRKAAPPPVREPTPLIIDHCVPNPCGTNADCEDNGERAVCRCARGYFGDPLTFCEEAECVSNDQCSQSQSCQQLKCIDPCVGQCGISATCTVRNHNPVCSCEKGLTGDPFVRCRPFSPEEYCSPSPCGIGAICKPGRDRAICSCPDYYLGNPLEECRPECERDTDCNADQSCDNQRRCTNPCRTACGEGALCNVRNHRPICSCPQFYIGDPYTRCRAECTAHEECPAHQACIDLKCENPCGPGVCGQGADCKVENHQPICSCPKGYTGHPFEQCRPFTRDDLCDPNPCGAEAICTPGYDREGNDRSVCTCPEGYIGNPLYACTPGSCTGHDDCLPNETCYQYQCQNACFVNEQSVCGTDAQCNVKNHTPVCSCAPGYEGNPLKACYPRSGARSGGSFGGFGRSNY